MTLTGLAKELGSLLTGPAESWAWKSYRSPVTMKAEPVRAEVKQPELLPKDILVDLESGDRSELFLEVAREDVSPQTMEGAFRQASQLGQAFANSSGSSFLSAQAMIAMQNWQMQNQPSAQTTRIDPFDISQL